MKIFSNSVKAIVLSLVFLSALDVVVGQHFEGELRLEFENLSERETEYLTLFIKKNRITLSGDLKNYGEFPLLRDALTIRADRNDVLIHSSDQVAIVNLRDMEMLIRQLMPQNGQSTDFEAEIDDRARIIETSETRRIHGFQATKLIIKDADDENRETHFWLADIGIDWQELLNPVISLGKSIGGGLDISSWDWPLDRTPLLIEYFEGGEIQMKAKVKTIQSRLLTTAETDIPEGKEAITLFQLMMQQN